MRTSRSTEVGGGVMVRVSNATPVSVTRKTFKYHVEILDINTNFEHCAHAGRNGKSLLFLLTCTGFEQGQNPIGGRHPTATSSPSQGHFWPSQPLPRRTLPYRENLYYRRVHFEIPDLQR